MEGELSSWSQAPSGHAYFSLKDEGALLGSVIWRTARARVAFKPAEGMKVVCRGKLSVFEKRGQYQFIVESMKLAGEGELWARFQRLKAKLEAEGLFAPERKRAIPGYPRCIGVVTSPTGAVIRDILTILRRRAPSVSVLLYPARVQGDGAAAEIVRGIQRLTATPGIDMLIIGRGGGSLEDLWEFNDEALARAIHASPIPIISAVGHETDFSISDFVADLRAATPSAAAEIVSEGYVDLRERIVTDLLRARRGVEARIREQRRHVEALLSSHALRRPELLLRDHQQRADAALRRMPEIVHRRMERLRASVNRVSSALEGHSPDLILKKGYAIIRSGKDGKPVTRAPGLKKNMMVEIQLQDGQKRAVVTDESADDLFQ
ncbi:exodeoxyribonuclease VII large subunit [soil metagenome]